MKVKKLTKTGKVIRVNRPIPHTKSDGLPGKEGLYNSKIHDKGLLDILSNGGFPEEFCRKYNICYTTYENWRRSYESFRAALSKGKLYGKAVWLKKPLERQENAFNQHYWTMIMRHAYKWGINKIPGLKDPKKTPTEMIEIAVKLLAEGKITNPVAHRLQELAMAKFNITQVSELQDRLESIEKLIEEKGFII